MGLSYHFKLLAPLEKTANDLEAFLRTVEVEAKALGFTPTLVLNALFDTPERREFARRLTTGVVVEDEKLKGIVFANDGRIRNPDAAHGRCRVMPVEGVVLVVTDAQQRETVFGFFRYPAVVSDIHGNAVAATETGLAWIFRDFVDSPDPRFRQIVKRFADAGFVAEEKDEFGINLSSLHSLRAKRP